MLQRGVIILPPQNKEQDVYSKEGTVQKNKKELLTLKT